jgi:hypothetical protein
MFQVPSNAGEIVDTVKANPVLLGLLIVIGLLTAFLFFWGIFRQTIKLAIFAGALSVGAWYWYFNIR